MSDEAILDIRDLGRMGYDEALALQRSTHAELVALKGRMTLFLVEHDPVITVSRRPSAASNLSASPEVLAQHGVVVAETDRGGDITYHGPGQLVVYPILDLNRVGLRVHSYMRFLEDIVIETLDHFGLRGQRDETATGVWVGDSDAGPTRKICAMGVRISRWVSMHGLALNVTTNLEHFGLIVPCGLADRPVTSMRAELGDRCPSMSDVKERLAARFDERIRALATSVAARP